MDISQNTDILDKGERQKADNISGLLGERSFTVKAVADEQEWTMIRKLYPEFTQGYFGLHGGFFICTTGLADKQVV